MKNCIPVIIFVFILCNAVFADTIHVPDDTSSIQGGISLASDGDTVLVSEGIYVENIAFIGKAITVASLYFLDGDTSHIENTIIDGSQPANPDNGSVVSFIYGEDTTSVLYGFTIRDGTGSLGKYFLIRWGGGVLCEEAGAKLDGNYIIKNHCSFNGWSGGGGVCVASGGTSTLPHLVLRNNRITDNKVSGGTEEFWAHAGGVLICNATVRIEGNLFARDSVSGISGASSGALEILGDPSRPTGIIKNNRFIDNVVYGPAWGAIGGAVTLEWTNEVRIENNDFIGNKATCVSGSKIWAQGGAISVTDQDITDYGEKLILKNRFMNNSVFCEGYANYINGGGIFLYKTLATISGNKFINNSSGSNSISSNPSGGAISTDESRFTIENNLIIGNRDADIGGGIDINRPQTGVSAAQQLLNNTIYANQSHTYGAGVAIRGGAIVNVMNNIIRANRAGANEQLYVAGGSVAYVNYNDIEDGYEGEGNIDEDPLFKDENENDFHLTEGSPCVDKGNPDPNYNDPEDVNNPGFALWSALGTTRNDMGAYGGPGVLVSGIKESEIKYPVVSQFSLFQNYPNPFNPKTVIRYALPVTCNLDLSIYNILGQKVATLVNKKQPAGSYNVEWDASGVSSGVYYYRLEAEGYSEVKKMVVIK